MIFTYEQTALVMEMLSALGLTDVALAMEMSVDDLVVHVALAEHFGKSLWEAA